jgi:hypothetical protein
MGGGRQSWPGKDRCGRKVGAVDLQGPALASGADFFQLALFREILVAKFSDLGGKWDEKSSIPRVIRGIGARKFVAL